MKFAPRAALAVGFTFLLAGLRAEPVASVIDRLLLMPVEGVRKSEIRDTFRDRRSGGRTHGALDILADRGTPVLAVEDGFVAKIDRSRLGGLTVYLIGADERYCHMYAHLDRFHAGLAEGRRVERGEVLGYVGTSGNAPRHLPHLHYAVKRLTAEKLWWRGSVLNPLPALDDSAD
jgi:peptidoglycan LD-endopeptidase LytH